MIKQIIASELMITGRNFEALFDKLGMVPYWNSVPICRFVDLATNSHAVPLSMVPSQYP